MKFSRYASVFAHQEVYGRQAYIWKAVVNGEFSRLKILAGRCLFKVVCPDEGFFRVIFFGSFGLYGSGTGRKFGQYKYPFPLDGFGPALADQFFIGQFYRVSVDADETCQYTGAWQEIGWMQRAIGDQGYKAVAYLDM